MDFSSFSNELPAPNSRTASTPSVSTSKRRRTPLTREVKQPDDPKRFTTTLNSRTASSPLATTETVVTAYSRPQREKLMYEVSVIVGTDRKPIADVVEAASPGLAKLAAQDKYGRHITVTGVKPLQQKRTRT